MSKIIVGVDDSERSKDAVALASLLARSSGAELILANAYPFDDLPSRTGGGADRHSYLRNQAEAAIKNAQEGVLDLPAITPRTIAEVSPAKGIQAIAEREDASLIVIGSSHRGGVGRVLAGTTAERLLHGAPCSVAVAPNGFRERDAHLTTTVAVAYDHSDESKAALRGATAVARALGARLRIVEVLDAMRMGMPALVSGPGYRLPPTDVEERTQAHLAEVAAGLPEEVNAEPVVTVGDPERMLAAECDTADLMVVGSRGYGPHRAVLLGSVSGRLVRDAGCPVVVVPRSIEAPLEELFRTPSGTQAV